MLYKSIKLLNSVSTSIKSCSENPHALQVWTRFYLCGWRRRLIGAFHIWKEFVETEICGSLRNKKAADKKNDLLKWDSKEAFFTEMRRTPCVWHIIHQGLKYWSKISWKHASCKRRGKRKQKATLCLRVTMVYLTEHLGLAVAIRGKKKFTLSVISWQREPSPRWCEPPHHLFQMLKSQCEKWREPAADLFAAELAF